MSHVICIVNLKDVQENERVVQQKLFENLFFVLLTGKNLKSET